jgi:hypothetical protein
MSLEEGQRIQHDYCRTFHRPFHLSGFAAAIDVDGFEAAIDVDGLGNCCCGDFAPLGVAFPLPSLTVSSGLSCRLTLAPKCNIFLYFHNIFLSISFKEGFIFNFELI